MGLNTDIFFIKAIKSNSELMSMLPAGDVYDNIANPDIDMDNVKIPYTILKYTKASEDETKPYDYTFSYSDISHDVNKPAFIRMFYYQCQTNNEILQESEQP